MKPITLAFTDSEGKTIKIYSTCSVKIGLFTKLVPIASRVDYFQNANFADIDLDEMVSFVNDVKALVVDAFGRQFTIDDLDVSVEMPELFKVIGELFRAGSIATGKNLTSGPATK